jgi:hypothetical protein
VSRSQTVLDGRHMAWAIFDAETGVCTVAWGETVPFRLFGGDPLGWVEVSLTIPHNTLAPIEELKGIWSI